jgi:hypothetical protein
MKTSNEIPYKTRHTNSADQRQPLSSQLQEILFLFSYYNLPSLEKSLLREFPQIPPNKCNQTQMEYLDLLNH